MRNVWKSSFDETALLWRYFTAERFTCLLERSCLYFAAANQFSDPFEGAVAIMPPDFPIDPRYKEMDGAEEAFWQLKRLTKINCWHIAPYESDAMWKLYADARKGVAICSTLGRMKAAIQPFRLQQNYGSENVWVGKVNYVDLAAIRLRAASLERFFHKHMAFAWEQEFRLAISLENAEENAVKVPPDGIEVSIDLKSFVERIVLGPELGKGESTQVIEQVRKAELQDRFLKSSLLGKPRYL